MRDEGIDAKKIWIDERININVKEYKYQYISISIYIHIDMYIQRSILVWINIRFIRTEKICSNEWIRKLSNG